jgi:hypothetical protein
VKKRKKKKNKNNCDEAAFIIFIFAFTSFQLLAQGPRFEIKYSEPLAVFVFVNELSSKKDDNTFKQLFLSSLYNRDK